jgi:hypothetical protein
MAQFLGSLLAARGSRLTRPPFDLFLDRAKMPSPDVSRVLEEARPRSGDIDQEFRDVTVSLERVAGPAGGD